MKTGYIQELYTKKCIELKFIILKCDYLPPTLITIIYDYVILLLDDWIQKSCTNLRAEYIRNNHGSYLYHEIFVEGFSNNKITFELSTSKQGGDDLVPIRRISASVSPSALSSQHLLQTLKLRYIMRTKDLFLLIDLLLTKCENHLLQSEVL